MTILIDGSPNNAQRGRASHRRDRPLRGRTSPRLLSPATRPHSNLRHVPGGDRRRTGARLRDTGFTGHVGAHHDSRGHSLPATEAFDRILTNHLLYCTVCDNNNGNCTVHNTTRMLGIEHQRYSVPNQAVRSGQHQSVLSLRSQTSAFSAAAASRPARTCRSTKRCRSAGRIPIRAFCGTAARRSANRAAFPAAIA